MRMFSMNARRMAWLSVLLLFAALGLILWTVAGQAKPKSRVERGRRRVMRREAGCPLLPPAQREIRRAERAGKQLIRNKGGEAYGESAAAIPRV